MRAPIALATTALLALGSGTTEAQDRKADAVQIVAPPYMGFYAKLLPCRGTPVRASAAVSDAALVQVCTKIDRMTANVQPARANMMTNGIEIHVIGKDEKQSDLPDRAIFGTTNDRGRGVCSFLACYCPEENILRLPGNRASGDICLHEIAHGIMHGGMDDGIRRLIDARYDDAIGRGLWPNVYAAKNSREFFAVMSQWYFGGHGQFLRPNYPAPGPAGLRDHDPRTYRLLDDIYTGRLAPQASRLQAAVTVSSNFRSHGGQRRARLFVDNLTARPLRLASVDLAGREEQQGTVVPYRRLAKTTYVGRVWRARDERGVLLSAFAVTGPQTRAIVGP